MCVIVCKLLYLLPLNSLLRYKLRFLIPILLVTNGVGRIVHSCFSATSMAGPAGRAQLVPDGAA